MEDYYSKKGEMFEIGWTSCLIVLFVSIVVFSLSVFVSCLNIKYLNTLLLFSWIIFPVLSFLFLYFSVNFMDYGSMVYTGCDWNDKMVKNFTASSEFLDSVKILVERDGPEKIMSGSYSSKEFASNLNYCSNSSNIDPNLFDLAF